jgi:DNA repair exonuclease SbcCD ATPase subunit
VHLSDACAQDFKEIKPRVEERRAALPTAPYTDCMRCAVCVCSADVCAKVDQQLAERVALLEEQQRQYGSKVEDAVDYLEQILDIEERNKEIFKDQADNLREDISRLQGKLLHIEGQSEKQELKKKISEIENSVKKVKSLQKYISDLEQKLENQDVKLTSLQMRIKAIELLTGLFGIVLVIAWTMTTPWK